MVNIAQNFNAAVNALGNGAAAVGNGLVNGAKFAGSLVINPSTQKTAEASIRSGIDTAYNALGNGLNKAIEVMERETSAPGQITGGIEALSTRIGTASFTASVINDDDSGNVKTLKKIGNGIRQYHTSVTNGVESASIAAGRATHSVVRLLLTPVRFITALLKMEQVGAMIQNTVALAIGFIVRGLVSVIGQTLGHILPYVAAAAAIGGLVIAFMTNPIATGFGVLGAAVLGLAVQNNQLNQRVGNLTNEIRMDKQHAKDTSFTGRAKALASLAYKHKGKVATGILAAGLVGLGIANKEAVASAVTTAGSAVASGARTAGAAIASTANSVYGYFFPAEPTSYQDYMFGSLTKAVQPTTPVQPTSSNADYLSQGIAKLTAQQPTSPIPAYGALVTA